MYQMCCRGVTLFLVVLQHTTTDFTWKSVALLLSSFPAMTSKPNKKSSLQTTSIRKPLKPQMAWFPQKTSTHLPPFPPIIKETLWPSQARTIPWVAPYRSSLGHREAFFVARCKGKRHKTQWTLDTHSWQSNLPANNLFSNQNAKLPQSAF